MITPAIYDWPTSVRIYNGIFFAGGEAIEAGLTSGGARNFAPEPGGRAWMEAEFRTMPHCGALDASWLASKSRNGAVFRIPVFNSKQLLSAADLGLSEPTNGILWDNDQPWDTGYGWQFDPGVTAVSAASEGSGSLVIDMSLFGAVLRHGHVIGHGKQGKVAAYHVDDVEYDGLVATASVSPPLRLDVEVNDFISFRPRMMATLQNPDSFRAKFARGKYMSPGAATFEEAIL